MPPTLYRDGALADGRSDRLRLGTSLLVQDGVIAWIRPSDDEGEVPADAEVVDASGSTIVPGMVDAHSHLTLPGGAHWIDRIGDPPERLVDVAEANARLLTSAGVRWARDVGSGVGVDPVDGRRRALSLGVRDRWRGRAGYPHVRAAGSWVFRTGTMGGRLWAVEAEDADALVHAVIGQLEDGADFIKLYLDGPERGVAPWSVAEVASAVDVAHARGARVTAHSSHLAGARVAVGAGVDAIEHGMELDADLARDMAARGTRLISTLCIFRSWRGFATTTGIERFVGPDNQAAQAGREERAGVSVRLAHAAGVAIATGTDFGGGSTRANQLAWEVECLVEAGLQPWEALGAATWRGGELLGEPDAGVIREGGPADIALVHGDPLSDPTALWRVWHAAWAP
jgi:imidazolonepropionase-like amidohydrolase